jgi:hypothetical protein
MRSRFCIWALAVLVAGCSPEPSSADTSKPAPDPVILRAIDELQTVSEPMVGAHPAANASMFMALDEEPRFHGGIIGSAKPTVHPAVKAILEQGVAAVPALIEHLDDARETKLVIQHEGFFGGIRLEEDYSPRDRTQEWEESEIDWLNSPPITTYTVKVGDLCYVLIGQIVNRPLYAVRYQPTAIVMINSPLNSPSLVRAVQKDWGQLSVAEHRRHLQEEAESGETWLADNALKRLLYYYPEEGEAVAVKLLQRLIAAESTKLIDETNAADMVSATTAFPSGGVDAATQDLFRSLQRLKPKNEYEQSSLDELALACFERMAGKGFDSDYRDYFTVRLKELQASETSYRVDQIKDALKRLEGVMKIHRALEQRSRGAANARGSLGSP